MADNSPAKIPVTPRCDNCPSRLKPAGCGWLGVGLVCREAQAEREVAETEPEGVSDGN